MPEPTLTARIIWIFSACLLAAALISPVQGESLTQEFLLAGDGDIVNQDGEDLDDDSALCRNLKPESWIGTAGGSHAPHSYLALRLHGEALPANIRILSAVLTLTNNRGRVQRLPVAVEIRAGLSAAPAPFLCTRQAPAPVPAGNLPSERALTASVVTERVDTPWQKDAPWSLDVTPLLAELQEKQQLGGTLSLIIRGTDPQYGKRFFFNHRQKNLDSASLPRLSVDYEIAVTPPVIERITLTAGEDGSLTLDGAPDSVQGGVSLRITNLRTGAAVTVQAAADGSFTAAIPAAGGDSLSLAVVNGTVSGDEVTLSVPVPIGLTLTYPAPGASIAADVTRVEGRHDGPANTGITVNGVTALVADGRFAALVPLQAGDNTLSVQAVDLAGSEGRAVLNVQSQGITPALRLLPNRHSGLAPLSLNFDYEFSGSMHSLALDADGDGGTDGLAHVYATPGWYFPVLTVTDDQGTPHQAEGLVLVQDGAAVDAMFGALWNGMNDALLAGDKAAALRYLNAGAQRKYAPVFEVLMPHFAGIVSSYSPLARGSVSEYIGEYAIVRPFENERRLFLIYFLKGKDGLWRLDEM